MKFLFAAVIWAISFANLFAQQNGRIAFIRQTVIAINTQTGYKVKTLDNDFFEERHVETPDNGLELKAYYYRGELKKMVYSVGLSVSMKTYTFYLSGPELVFVFEQDENYPEKADGLDYSKLVPAAEKRFYFDKGMIFKTIIKGESRPGGPDPGDLLSIFNDLKKDLADHKGR